MRGNALINRLRAKIIDGTLSKGLHSIQNAGRTGFVELTLWQLINISLHNPLIYVHAENTEVATLNKGSPPPPPPPKLI